MNGASRTAGCPAAERNVLTKPTGGASPVSTSVGVDSPLAQPRQHGRAVPLKRRRKVRDDFLGRDSLAPSPLWGEGRVRGSQSPLRKARRQTLHSCLVQPARPVDARFLNESLAPVSRASSAMSFTKNWNHSVPSAVRPSMSLLVKLRHSPFNYNRLATGFLRTSYANGPRRHPCRSSLVTHCPER